MVEVPKCLYMQLENLIINTTVIDANDLKQPWKSFQWHSEAMTYWNASGLWIYILLFLKHYLYYREHTNENLVGIKGNSLGKKNFTKCHWYLKLLTFPLKKIVRCLYNYVLEGKEVKRLSALMICQQSSSFSSLRLAADWSLRNPFSSLIIT